MSFEPNAGDKLELFDRTFVVQAHPGASGGIPWAQDAGKATVYQVQPGGKKSKTSEPYALKVFKKPFRSQDITRICEQLGQLTPFVGLEAAERRVVHPGMAAQVDADLNWAVLMPWMPGKTWFDVLIKLKEEGPAYSPEEAVPLACHFASILADLERRGFAHTDLSSGNFLVDLAPLKVSLIDLEDFFGPGFSEVTRPSMGTPGYQHRDNTGGIWRPEGDRFSGAILVVEMLAAASKSLAKLCSGESFFDQSEVQTDCRTYDKVNALLRRIHPPLSDLFGRAWNSGLLKECPTLSEWHGALSDLVVPPVKDLIDKRLDREAAAMLRARPRLQDGLAASADRVLRAVSIFDSGLKQALEGNDIDAIEQLYNDEVFAASTLLTDEERERCRKAPRLKASARILVEALQTKDNAAVAQAYSPDLDPYLDPAEARKARKIWETHGLEEALAQENDPLLADLVEKFGPKWKPPKAHQKRIEGAKRRTQLYRDVIRPAIEADDDVRILDAVGQEFEGSSWFPEAERARIRLADIRAGRLADLHEAIRRKEEAAIIELGTELEKSTLLRGTARVEMVNVRRRATVRKLLPAEPASVVEFLASLPIDDQGLADGRIVPLLNGFFGLLGPEAAARLSELIPGAARLAARSPGGAAPFSDFLRRAAESGDQDKLKPILEIWEEEDCPDVAALLAGSEVWTRAIVAVAGAQRKKVARAVSKVPRPQADRFLAVLARIPDLLENTVMVEGVLPLCAEPSDRLPEFVASAGAEKAMKAYRALGGRVFEIWEQLGPASVDYMTDPLLAEHWEGWKRTPIRLWHQAYGDVKVLRTLGRETAQGVFEKFGVSGLGALRHSTDGAVRLVLDAEPESHRRFRVLLEVAHASEAPSLFARWKSLPAKEPLWKWIESRPDDADKRVRSILRTDPLAEAVRSVLAWSGAAAEPVVFDDLLEFGPEFARCLREGITLAQIRDQIARYRSHHVLGPLAQAEKGRALVFLQFEHLLGWDRLDRLGPALTGLLPAMPAFLGEGGGVLERAVTLVERHGADLARAIGNAGDPVLLLEALQAWGGPAVRQAGDNTRPLLRAWKEPALRSLATEFRASASTLDCLSLVDEGEKEAAWVEYGNDLARRIVQGQRLEEAAADMVLDRVPGVRVDAKDRPGFIRDLARLFPDALRDFGASATAVGSSSLTLEDLRAIAGEPRNARRFALQSPDLLRESLKYVSLLKSADANRMASWWGSQPPDRRASRLASLGRGADPSLDLDLQGFLDSRVDSEYLDDLRGPDDLFSAAWSAACNPGQRSSPASHKTALGLLERQLESLRTAKAGPLEVVLLAIVDALAEVEAETLETMVARLPAEVLSSITKDNAWLLRSLEKGRFPHLDRAVLKRVPSVPAGDQSFWTMQVIAHGTPALQWIADRISLRVIVSGDAIARVLNFPMQELIPAMASAGIPEEDWSETADLLGMRGSFASLFKGDSNRFVTLVASVDRAQRPRLWEAVDQGHGEGLLQDTLKVVRHIGRLLKDLPLSWIRVEREIVERLIENERACSVARELWADSLPDWCKCGRGNLIVETADLLTEIDDVGIRRAIAPFILALQSRQLLLPRPNTLRLGAELVDLARVLGACFPDDTLERMNKEAREGSTAAFEVLENTLAEWWPWFSRLADRLEGLRTIQLNTAEFFRRLNRKPDRDQLITSARGYPSGFWKLLGAFLSMEPLDYPSSDRVKDWREFGDRWLDWFLKNGKRPGVFFRVFGR